MTPNTQVVVKAALTAFDQLQGQDLHQLARSVPAYTLREHDEDFVNDVASWKTAIEAADPRALRLVILLTAQHGDGKGTLPVACAILRASELHEAGSLVLEALRDLIYYHDPAVFRSLLPFLVRSWDGGWVSFRASAPASRAELVADFFEASLPMTVAERLDWPSLDSNTENDIPEDVDQKDYERWTSMILEVFQGAAPETQQRLTRLVREAYRRANSVAARTMAGRALIELGVWEHLVELTESRFESLRRLGFWKAFETFETACLVLGRYGHLRLAAPTELGETDRQRQQSLFEALKSAKKIAVAVKDGRLALCWHEASECLFFGYDPKTQAWDETKAFVPDLEKGRNIIGLRIEFPPAARDRYFKFVMTDNCGGGPTYYLHYDAAKNLVAARTVTEKKAQLAGKQGAEMRKHKPRAGAPVTAPEPRPAPPQPASPQPVSSQPVSSQPASPQPVSSQPVSSQPASPQPASPQPTRTVEKRKTKRRALDSGFEIRPAPKDARLLLPEKERLAVYSAETKELLLDPPTSVAIVVTEQHFVSWCAVGHRGRAGGRGASSWAVELYSRETRQLVARHEIQNRSVIGWCWPVRLRCARTHGYRLIVLLCRSEDFTREIYLARVKDTTFVETLDRTEASAALRA